MIARAAHSQHETARATLAPDGRISIHCGAVSHGQGHASVFAAIAARALGLDPARVDYVSGSSDHFESATGSFASRSAGIAGPAVLAAAGGLIEALTPHAARHLDAEAAAVSYAEGTFRNGEQSLPIETLAARLSAPVTHDARFAPDAASFPNGAPVCELDRDIGGATLLRYGVVEDVGTVLNPAIAKGQVHGGIAQGLGQALAERIAYDPATGQPLTGSLMDFALPRAADLPAFDVASQPVPPPGIRSASRAPERAAPSARSPPSRTRWPTPSARSVSATSPCPPLPRLSGA